MGKENPHVVGNQRSETPGSPLVCSKDGEVPDSLIYLLTYPAKLIAMARIAPGQLSRQTEKQDQKAEVMDSSWL